MKNPALIIENPREYWLSVAERLARPVLSLLAGGRFNEAFPLEGDAQRGRGLQASLEACSRLLAGLAPWLESEIEDAQERALRDELLMLARESLKHALDMESETGTGWKASAGHGLAAQDIIVDAGFFAHAFLRAPNALWRGLDVTTQQKALSAFAYSKTFYPYPNNWLWFSAIVEAFLDQIGEPVDAMRVDYAVRQHEAWYVGDGVYQDGARFHYDYYNSFVIHPMQVDTLRALRRFPLPEALERAEKRLTRYAGILERQISPEGTYPPVGRSITYRFGAFQALSQAACSGLLPEGVSQGQVRSALTAVIHRQIELAGTFDEQGFLRIGFAGHQPKLAESYITNASVYLCATVLLPLALPPSHPFWSEPTQDWTARKLWNGEDLPADSALAD